MSIFWTILILLENKGVTVLTHTGGYTCNLGFTFYSLIIKKFETQKSTWSPNTLASAILLWDINWKTPVWEIADMDVF